jgi:arginase family enzyme
LRAERRGTNKTLVETNLPTLDSHPQPTSDVALERTGREPEESVGRTNADDEGENDRRLTTSDTKTRHRLSQSRLIQPLILESNCYGALGALGSVQASAGTPFSRLGMVEIDAHGDCVSQPASPIGKTFPSMDPHDVVMVCLRADDPLEQAVIDQSGIEIVPVADVKGDCSQLRAEGDSAKEGMPRA